MMSDIVRAAVQKMRPKVQQPEEKPKRSPNAIRRVHIRQDTRVKFPQLYLPIYVHGTPYEERQYAEMFSRAGCYRADRPAKADLVIFAGSTDVNPDLYGEPKHTMTSAPNKEEDEAGMKMFRHCKKHGIPMLGVCKGAQLLHVAMGGKLYQHIDQHYGDHSIYDVRNKVTIEKVSSNHHQAVIPQEGMEILAHASKSTKKWRNPLVNDGDKGFEVEAFFYEETGILGIQGHPEYRGYDFFAAWVMDLIEHHILYNPKFEYDKGGVRRLIPNNEKDKK